VTRRAAGVQPLQRLSRLPQTTTVEDVTMGGFGGLALLFAIAAAVGVLNYHGRSCRRPQACCSAAWGWR
jgi:hypothetical protein